MDNWGKRIEKMKCCGCMFFVAKESIKNKSSQIGRCRKKSPTLNGWPVVFNNDWCGEHKLDEEKI